MIEPLFAFRGLPVLKGPRATAAFAVLLAMIVATFALSQNIIARAAGAQQGTAAHFASSDVLRSLPYPILEEHYSSAHTHYVLIAISILQTLLLMLAYIVIRARTFTRWDGVVSAVGALGMVVVALGAKAMVTGDPYVYIGFGRLGIPAAYDPPTVAFAGQFSQINQVWGLPLLASPYGPLWIWLMKAVTGSISDLGTAVFALRVLGVAALAATLAALSRRPAAALAVVLLAMNPAPYMEYVANPHNDLIPIALVVIAMAVVVRLPILSLVLVVLASLVKLPFVILGLVVFARMTSLRQRLAWATAMVVVAGTAAWLLGGHNYLHNLLRYSGTDSSAAHGIGVLARRTVDRMLMLFALLATLAALLRGWVFASASFTFAGFSPVFINPWYVGWGLPYAALDERALVWFLCGWPLVAMVVESAFPGGGTAHAMLALILLAVVAEVAGRFMRRTAPTQAPLPASI